ncbi:unnamed protein product [Discula destructiva]
MTGFEDLPAELREQVVWFSLPEHIDLARPEFPPTILSLLLASKQIKNDVHRALQLLDLTVSITRPSDISKLRRLTKLVQLTTIHLPIYYHSPIMQDKDKITMCGDRGLLDAWIPHIQDIPLAASVRTVILDLTPAPQWLLEKRPNWLASHLNDKRVAAQFIRDWVVPCALALLPLLRAACAPDIEIQVAGKFGKRSERHLISLMAQAQRVIPAIVPPVLKLNANFIPLPHK